MTPSINEPPPTAEICFVPWYHEICKAADRRAALPWWRRRIYDIRRYFEE